MWPLYFLQLPRTLNAAVRRRGCVLLRSPKPHADRRSHYGYARSTPSAPHVGFLV